MKVNISQVWFRIGKRTNISHRLLHTHGTEIEFYCGKQRDVSALLAPLKSTQQCKICLDYIRHEAEK